MAAIVVLNEDLEVLAMDGLMDRYFAVASVRKGSGRPIVCLYRLTLSIMSRPWTSLENLALS